MAWKITLKGADKLIKNFKDESNNISKSINATIKKSALLMAYDIRAETPVKSGTLKKGIYPTYSHFKAIIEPHNSPYAGYVHEGTRPHIIRPKTKQALFWKGAKHPVRSVKHPGTKANPFMERGFQKGMPKVILEFQRMTDNITKNLARK